MFVDPANGNFHLLPGSPAIDAGSTQNGYQVVDIDGNPRLVGGDIDLGVYEYGQGGSSSQLPPVNHLLVGDSSNNTLMGTFVEDALYGGSGSDLLIGGQGADVFIFMQGDSGVDTISDFHASEGDQIDLSDLLQDYDPITDLITDFVRISESGGNSTVAVDFDGLANGSNFTSVAILEDVTGLTDEVTLETNKTIITF